MRIEQVEIILNNENCRQAKQRSYKTSCKEKLGDHSRMVRCSCKPDSWGCSNQTLETASEEAAQCSWAGKDEVYLVGMPQQPLVQQNSRPETQLSETHRINNFAKNMYFKDLPPQKCRNGVQHANKYLFTSTFLIKSFPSASNGANAALPWQHLCITACRCTDTHQHNSGHQRASLDRSPVTTQIQTVS